MQVSRALRPSHTAGGRPFRHPGERVGQHRIAGRRRGLYANTGSATPTSADPNPTSTVDFVARDSADNVLASGSVPAITPPRR